VPDFIAEALSRCEDEPIRVPGSVQQHGFFLLADISFEKVLVASENAARFLNHPLALILGARLDTLFGRELMQALRAIQNAKQQQLQEVVTYVGSFRVGDHQFSVMTHYIGSGRALEFEREDRLVGAEMMNAVITNFVATLERVGSNQDLCDALSEQIAELTGFDRVMLYSFNEENHGTVLSEVNNGKLPSYLGLRFPASDIPQQARELYILNTTRIIPDANYEPSKLVGSTTRPVAQLDLSLSVLRSVSPIHLQYMRNMGTISSMSISIVLDRQLWGLVSCHCAEPKTVPYLIRSACDMLTKMAVTQLNTFRATARFNEMVRFHNAQRDLLTTLAGEQNYAAALLRQSRALLKITNASGVAVLVDGTFSGEGLLPDEASVHRLSDWLDEDEGRQIFATHHLQSVAPWAKAIGDVASGLLAVRISSVRRRYVMWFRPEVVSTVRWAGEPVKQQDADSRLSPRSSFNQWKEIVQGRSEPWTEMEVESATDFRSALIAIGLHRAEEAVELGEARFEQLTQALPLKIFTADDAGRLTYVNQRWFEDGLEPTGLWFERIGMHPEDLESSVALWQQCVAAGIPFEAEARLSVRNEKAERWNIVRVVPFQRTGASRAGWIGTLLDLTESKERELALRMTEKLALTGRMTSVIAHEINNPLEAIANLMYLLRNETKSNGPASGYIDMMDSELERISGITKQTLRWNREPTDRTERFALDVLVVEVLRLFAGKIRNKQITVDRDEDQHIQMWGVMGQVRQVLASLISNAVDAAPIEGKITIRGLQREGETGFSVQDNGGGISESLRLRLFEPFVSTKGDLGNGLGLYISREIVDRHQGMIEVDTGDDIGTTMTVWLPREGQTQG
jgi:light-regulated signal transduction histidine kinase (bacteriophytochrome)